MEGQQHGYINRDFASVTGAVGLVADRVSRLEAVVEQMRPPFEGHGLVGENTRYWGVWHPERGWEVLPGRILWYTTNRAIAEAQRDVTIREWKDGDLYEVRCIEEWFDTMEG